MPQVLPIGVAVTALPLATEDRTGYRRTSCRHWNAGDLPADGCNTRQEVLPAEAVDYPEIGPGCALSEGMWVSYDEVSVTDAGRLDIDHMVPLAEAWDSKYAELSRLHHSAWLGERF